MRERTGLLLPDGKTEELRPTSAKFVGAAFSTGQIFYYCEYANGNAIELHRDNEFYQRWLVEKWDVETWNKIKSYNPHISYDNLVQLESKYDKNNAIFKLWQTYHSIRKGNVLVGEQTGWSILLSLAKYNRLNVEHLKESFPYLTSEEYGEIRRTVESWYD